MSDDIWRWSASRIAAAIRAREISAREAVDSCLDRMAAVNGTLNAVTVDLSASAREGAARADAAIAGGDALGPLHGVPVTIKENVDQQGSATTNGVVGFRNVIATEDSPVVANWKRAGAIIIGRTNTPAFSFRLDTVNDLRGRTYSPWSRVHTPGGSSGGAASCVAAGIAPLAHGNDIAGSVRFPAYCCGGGGHTTVVRPRPAYNPTQTAERSMSSQLMSVQDRSREASPICASVSPRCRRAMRAIRGGLRHRSTVRRFRRRSARRSCPTHATLPARACILPLRGRSRPRPHRSPPRVTTSSTRGRRGSPAPRNCGSRCRCRSSASFPCR